MKNQRGMIKRRALKIDQSIDHPIYTFCITPAELADIAEVSRISRSSAGSLIGYQRPEVRRHVKEIVEYLDGDDVVFPNPIILALSSEIQFKSSRGPYAFDGLVTAGLISIPTRLESGEKPGWIVDGQQRALALSKSKLRDFPVPINAFIADEVALQRDQFIRINNAKPLPRGLVSELLPEVTTPLPPRLAARRIPSAVCDLLNRDEDSPFYGMIKRPSSSKEERSKAVVTDTSVIRMIEESLGSASGCLFPLRNIATGETDFDAIWAVLTVYWASVKEVFPSAWGKPPTKSRLMHGVGIRSMGRLMDKIMGSVDASGREAKRTVKEQLSLIKPICRWTEGSWDDLAGLGWNELQNVHKHTRMLSNLLIRAYLQARQGAP